MVRGETEVVYIYILPVTVPEACDWCCSVFHVE